MMVDESILIDRLLCVVVLWSVFCSTMGCGYVLFSPVPQRFFALHVLMWVKTASLCVCVCV